MSEDINTAVRFVDDYVDHDPKTRNSCPGKVNGHNLILIGKQIERRFFNRGKTKHLIYLEEGTRNIWYKQSNCNAGVVKMGFSLSELDKDSNSVPMEEYAKYFIDKSDPEWLKQNDFVLV